MKVVVYGQDAQKMKEAAKDAVYQNPFYFDKALDCDKVILIGEYPDVESAYKAAGVLIEVVGRSAKPEPKVAEKVEAPKVQVKSKSAKSKKAK